MDVSGVTVIGSNRVDSVDIDDENEPILVKDEDENEPQKKKPKNKNVSLVWDHFSKGEKVGGKQKSTCNYCGTEFTCNSDQNGTSSMRTHILVRCKVYELSEFNMKKNKGDKRQTTLVELYVEILRLFYVVTEKFSGSLYVTCNTFFKEVMTIKIAIGKLEVSDDVNLVLLARGMNNKYDKYWGQFSKINPLLLYANVLDPRYKFEYVRWSLGKYHEKREVESKIVEMKDGMKRLYNWYEKRSMEDGQAPNVIESSRNKDKMGKRRLDLCEAMDSEFLQHMEEETNMVSKSELERYWMEGNEDAKNENFDLLTWWSINCAKYPILSQMARDILAIPVSTVASESAFSTGGRVLDPYRTSLSPKMAEALICTQNWLRNPSEISLRDALDEVEELESVVSQALEDSCVTEL